MRPQSNNDGRGKRQQIPPRPQQKRWESLFFGSVTPDFARAEDRREPMHVLGSWLPTTPCLAWKSLVLSDQNQASVYVCMRNSFLGKGSIMKRSFDCIIYANDPIDGVLLLVQIYAAKMENSPLCC